MRIVRKKQAPIRAKMTDMDWWAWWGRMHATGVVHLVEGTALCLGLVPHKPKDLGWQRLQKDPGFNRLYELASLKFGDPASAERVLVPPELAPGWPYPVFVRAEAFFLWASSIGMALPMPLVEWQADPSAAARRARVSLATEYDDDTGEPFIPDDKQHLLGSSSQATYRSTGALHDRALGTVRNVLATVVLSNHANLLRGSKVDWSFLPPKEPGAEHRFAEYSKRKFVPDRETIKSHVAKAIVEALGGAESCAQEFPALVELVKHPKKGLKQ